MTIQTEPRAEVAPAKALWRATAEVVSAGQQVIIDRLELLRSELAGDVADLAVAIGVVVATGVVLLIGWVLLAVAGAFLLARWLPWDAALGIVAVVHIVLGGVLARVSVGRVREARRIEVIAAEPSRSDGALRG